MKPWVLALAFVAVLGMSTFAEARRHSKGIHGKITAVTETSMTITTGGKKNPRTMTVQFGGTTPVTIDGAPGKLDSSAVGKRVVIQGGTNGDVIMANSIAVVTKHKGKTPTT